MGGACSSSVSYDKKLVIIGGGVGGRHLANLADGVFDGTNIDKRGASLYKIGLPLAVVESSAPFLIPFEANLTRGKTITGQAVTEVDSKQVTLADGTKIDFDYLVVAIGTYQGSTEPADHVPQGTFAEVKAYYDTAADKIKNAGSIVIIGGGPVGLELAGEIRDSHPDKKITVVHSRPALVDSAAGVNSPVEFQQKLLKATVDRKIDVKLSQRADLSGLDNTATGFYEGKDLQVPLSGGETLTADLVLTAFGNQTRSLKGLPVDAKGFVKVNKSLQVEGFNNIFAIGDCAGTTEPKMGVFAADSPQTAGHSPFTLNNIKLLAAAAETGGAAPKLKERAAPDNKVFQVVPIGSRNKEKAGAVTGAPGFLHGVFLNFKRKDYFVGDVWKSLNRPVPKA